MIIEIVSSVAMSGILAGTYFYQSGGGSDDHRKIEKIAAACGLVVNDGGNKRSIRIHRRAKGKNYAEYVYQIPLGLSFADFQRKQDNFQDGLNVKRAVIDVSFADFKAINWRAHPKEVVEQIRKVVNKRTKQRKEIEMEYDGMLKIRVYDNGLEQYVPFDDDTMRTLNGWEVAVGQTRKEFLAHDFDKVAHILVGGATDFGKSNWLKSTITSLIHRKPNDATFTLIDLKGGLSFGRYRGVKQVETIAKTPEEVLEALESVQERLNETFAMLEAKGFEDVKEAKVTKRHFVVIDEAADIAEDKACQAIIKDIARRGRAAGFRLIYATQYPTSQTVDSQVKRNCIGRLCFVIDTEIASRVVLDEGGAEKLPLVQGRAIYKTVKCTEVQTPHITNDFIKTTIAPYVNIRARKEPDVNEGGSEEGTQGRKNTLIIEDA